VFSRNCVFVSLVVWTVVALVVVVGAGISQCVAPSAAREMTCVDAFMHRNAVDAVGWVSHADPGAVGGTIVLSTVEATPTVPAYAYLI